MSEKPSFPATLSPADFPVGSAESRAAARSALDRRQEERIAASVETQEWRGAYGLAGIAATDFSEAELRRHALELFDQGITTFTALVRAVSDERKRRAEVESRTSGNDR